MKHALSVLLLACLQAAPAVATHDMPLSVADLVANTCLDCHNSADPQGGLDLESASFDLSSHQGFATWVKVYDRVAAGEMPPPADYGELAADSRDPFLAALADKLRSANLAKQKASGRVQYRRLNRVEYENTLRDLLKLPNLEVADMLPADDSAHGFDNVGAALDLSYVQMSRYLESADAAIEQATVLEPRPETGTVHLEAMTNGRLSQVVKKGREAVAIDNFVGLLRQPNTAQAPWWWARFTPPIEGQYRLRMKAFGFYWDQGEVKPAERTHVVTLQARYGSTFRSLDSFDLPGTQEEAAVLQCTTFLRPGEQLHVHIETLDDRTKPGQMDLDEYSAPGVAVEWLEIDGPLIEQWPPESYKRLFGDLRIEPWTPESGLKEPPTPIVVDGMGKRAKLQPAKRNKITLYHVVSENPLQDAEALLGKFAERAFRRPVENSELTDILELVRAKIEQKYCFQEAMQIGYQAILCSPEFLFLQEPPGPLDDYALASRLSYFLWNSLPDDELLSLAAAGRLKDAEVLRRQVERMIGDAKSRRFVENFCGQWLDLRDITITQPDEDLYPEFDQLLLDSMVRETQTYFAKMLDEDLGVRYLIDSDFAMINGRLAEHYGIPDVDGVAIRQVSLPEESVRGGLLTQASILKVTANGTTTSPVTRGAWVLDRLLGQPAPPPPPNVSAVEPDLRGTTTIREQLAKHRDNAACATCHERIDPPGFALESFDVIGGYRHRYRSLGEGEAVDRTRRGGRPVKYKLGLPVDGSGTAPGGEKFEDVNDFRRIVLAQEEQLARSLAEKLLTYATGAGIEFADREVVEKMLHETKDAQYGLRSLIHAVVQSRAFQMK